MNERKIKNLKGNRFGRLLVLGDSGKRRAGGYVGWDCLCDCGNSIIIYSGHLRLKHTRSCGCLRNESHNLKHGDRKIKTTARLYHTWLNMKARCYNKKAKDFKYYGGCGIEVCPEWKDYMPFKTWALNNGYADNLTIDRINNDKGYYPENCQWITQSENTRKRNKEDK